MTTSQEPTMQPVVSDIWDQLDGALHHDIDTSDITAILEALTNAGYDVVKMPPPAGMDEDGQIWFDVTEHRVDTTGREPEIWWGRIERTVDQLRVQAAELLSVVALVDAIKAGAK